MRQGQMESGLLNQPLDLSHSVHSQEPAGGSFYPHPESLFIRIIWLLVITYQMENMKTKGVFMWELASWIPV